MTLPGYLRVRCDICDAPINVDDRSGAVQREITGWETLRRRGGANQITDRATTGHWRHAICGAEPGQDRLFT